MNGGGHFPKLGFGLGLRPDHHTDVLKGRSSAAWFEVITENFMGDGGRPLYVLDRVRRDYPVALHGVSLSLGSSDPLNQSYLLRLKNMVARFEPAVVSDHLCWTGVEGQNLHDLLPLPYTEEAIAHVVARIDQIQNFLGRRILIENVSSYLTYTHSEMREWEFLREIVKRADCGVLLDVNNVYVSSVNHGFDPVEYLCAIPREAVGQIHLAGHSEQVSRTGKRYLVDTHDAPVCDDVWDLYSRAVELFGDVSTMIEWDANIPEFTRLESELLKLKEVARGDFARADAAIAQKFTEMDATADHRPAWR